VLHLFSLALLLLYAAWALLPPPLLSALGLSFLPQQYWAVAVPTYLSVVFFTFVLVIYPALGMLSTPGSGDIRHVADSMTSYRAGRPLPGAVPPLHDERPEDVLAHLRSK
jgi:phosphatidylinositol glycan class P protein